MMWGGSSHLLTLAAVAATVCLAQRVGIRRHDDGPLSSSDTCHQMASCSECIRSPECAWCADPEWDPVIHSDLTFSDLTHSATSAGDAANTTLQAKEIKARCDRVTK